MRRDCLCCGVQYMPNNLKCKLTEHHVIPKCMEPKANFTIWLCETCHKRLSALYVKNPRLTTKQVPSSFEEFKSNYEELREKYHNKEIDRGQFGEGLWTNLVNYLELKEKEETK